MTTPLDGTWRVIRTGGLLPPLIGIRKHIRGDRGETRIGLLPGLPFRVHDLELHYRGPLSGFVDKLKPDQDGFRGLALLHGREYGRFILRR